MSRRPQQIYPPSPRELLRGLVLSMLLGAIVGLILWVGNPRRSIAVQVGVSISMGFWIYLSAVALIALVRRPLAGVSEGLRRLAYGLVFFAAGVLAWALNALSVTYLSFGLVRLAPVRHWWSTLGFAGLLALAAGFVFYFYERLRQRLEASIDELKDKEYAERELATARTIQRRLLPPEEVSGDGFVVAARNLPARIVAGDFYDLFRIADGSLTAVVADVAGKGMGAALLMASVKAMLPLLADGRSVEETLRELNRRLDAELGPREFVALAMLRYETASGSFELANAGLPDPYLLGDGAPRALEVPGPRLPLGVRREVAYRVLGGRLEPGQRLLLVTDGPPEALLADGEPLGYARLAALAEAAQARAATAGGLLDDLLAHLRATTVPEPGDDWTALALERTSA